MTVPSSSVLAFTTLLRVRRSHWSFRGCRVHSELKPELILRPASLLALLTRTFTFELALAGSPRASVEYDYVGKQSIPTTGLSPASPTALWAAEQGLTPRSLPALRHRPRRTAARAKVVGRHPHGPNPLKGREGVRRETRLDRSLARTVEVPGVVTRRALSGTFAGSSSAIPRRGCWLVSPGSLVSATTANRS